MFSVSGMALNPQPEHFAERRFLMPTDALMIKSPLFVWLLLM
jgi:hypothetical protein